MEEKIIKITAGIIGGMTIIIVASLFYFPKLHIMAEAAAERRAQLAEEREAQMNGLQMLKYNTASAEEEEDVSFPQQLRIAVPKDVAAGDIKVTNDYVTQTITVQIPDADEDYLYDYPMVGRSDHINNLTYESEKESGIIEIVLDSVFEVEQTVDEQYLYLDFLTPHEVYDKVVVIDAGHGGKNPGATKQGINEKDINLAILLEVQKLFETAGNESIGVYYTRTTDCNPSYENRAGLANKAEADLFVSIHSNSTKSGRMSSINGTSVMYDEEKAEEEKGSMQFAQICLEEMLSALGTMDKGLVEGHKIYILRSAEMPAALIEVGFMTNEEELNNLNDPEYQQKAAGGIYQAINRALEEGF